MDGIRFARPLVALAAMLAVLAPATAAQAHNALTEATPAKNATLKKAPAQVKLKFLQKLNPDATELVVSDAQKTKVATSEPEVDGATVTVEFTEPPANGEYTVGYRVASTDGHTVNGSYRFTVAGPAPSSAAPSSAAPVAAAPPSSAAPAPQLAAEQGSTGRPVAAWIVAGVMAVLVLVLGGIFVSRRSARRS